MMLLALLLALPNALLSWLGRRFFHLPGLDIAPYGIMLVAAQGEGILLAALVLPFSKAFHSISGMRNLWFTVPLTAFIGYLALFIQNAFALLLLYHAASAVLFLAMGRMHIRYLLFVLLNLSTNLLAIRLFPPF